jgi:hypothetical protein
MFELDVDVPDRAHCKRSSLCEPTTGLELPHLEESESKSDAA